MVGVAVPVTTKTVLDVRDLHVSYAGAVHALKGVSLAVDEGEVLAVLGANGAGKSTLLRALSGTLQPAAAARSTFDGRRPRSASDPADIARAGLVQVPEGRRVFAELTVEENLRAGALAAKQQAHEARRWVDELFPILNERRTQRAGLLSGGEQQMLAIARALMASPKLLTLDEPSLGLAPRIVEQLREVIAEINRRGVTVVLVEQNAAMALAVADRAVVLEVGEVALRRHRRGARRQRGHQGPLPRLTRPAKTPQRDRDRRQAPRGRRPQRPLRRHQRALRGLLHRRAGLDARADRPQRRRQVDLPERAQRRLSRHQRQRPLRRRGAHAPASRTGSPRSASPARSRTSRSRRGRACSTTCSSPATG